MIGIEQIKFVLGGDHDVCVSDDRGERCVSLDLARNTRKEASADTNGRQQKCPEGDRKN
jgi:hypothetical protein